MPYIERLAVYNHFKVPDFAVDVALPPDPADDLAEPRLCHLILTGENSTGKTTLLRRIAEEVERYQKYTNYKRLVEVSREDGLIPGILRHGRVVSASKRASFGPPSRESVAISQFFADLMWTKPARGDSFEPEHFAAAYLPDDRRLRVYRVRGEAELELGATLARQSIADQFLQYLVNRKLRQAKVAPDSAGARAATEWFAELVGDLAELFGIPGLQLAFDAQRCDLRLCEPGGASYDFYRLSSGHAAALAILGEVMLRVDRGDESCASGVVLIDELDAHLHPAMQERILPWLTARFPSLQFVVTTNSPAVICSVQNALVLDLGSPHQAIPSSELMATPYGRLLTGHFGLETDLDLISTAKLHRLKELLDREALSDGDEAELAVLTEELRGTSTSLALEAWSRSLKGRSANRAVTADGFDGAANDIP